MDECTMFLACNLNATTHTFTHTGEFEATEEEGELMKTEEGEDGWRQGEEKLGGWEMEEGWWLKSYGLDGDVEEYAGEGEEGEHMQQGWESGAQPSEEALLRRECELEQQQHVLPFEPDELVGSALPAPGVQQSMELTYSQVCMFVFVSSVSQFVCVMCV